MYLRVERKETESFIYTGISNVLNTSRVHEWLVAGLIKAKSERVDGSERFNHVIQLRAH